MLLIHSLFYGLTSLALVPLAVAPSDLPAGLARTLQASRWQQRVLLVGAPNTNQADFQQQKKLLTRAAPGLAERDFTVIEVPYAQLAPADRQYWTQELKQPLDRFVVVLIGKDGGIKRTATQPLAPASLFGTVDKMSMRREEMRSQKKD